MSGRPLWAYKTASCKRAVLEPIKVGREYFILLIKFQHKLKHIPQKTSRLNIICKRKSKLKSYANQDKSLAHIKMRSRQCLSIVFNL